LLGFSKVPVFLCLPVLRSQAEDMLDTGPDIGLLAKGCSDGHRVMSMYHQIMHGNSNRTVVESS